MRTRVRILPYKRGSASARAISQACGIPRVRMPGTRFRPRSRDTIVNWGHSGCLDHGGLPGRFWMGTVRYLNHPSNVSIARDKRETLTLLSHNGVPTVEWTLDVDVALQWFSHGDVVVQRNTATGQGGAGIVVCDPTLPGNVAPTAAGVLFTKYFKRKQEFRIHVWGNDVLDIQLKKKRRGEEADPRIRSHNNGWVFCREGVVCPEQVSTAAVEAVRALGLDFGAVDIGWNERKQTAAVFEVNTAPGVEGTTLDRYVSKIKEAVL